MWRKFVKNYLSFTRQERRGIVVLCILILLCWCIPAVWRYLRKDAPPDFSSFRKEVALFERRRDSLQQVQRHGGETKNRLNADALPEPFPFDPNTLSAGGWLKLGMPVREIRIIRHYLAAGGHFYRKEDLKKIYGLSREMYDRLAPYIRLPVPKRGYGKKKAYLPDSSSGRHYSHDPHAANHDRDEIITLDINTADSLAWVRLRGIGPVLSARIIRFREALGGFYSLQQVAEVYGLPDSTFRQIERRLKISTIDLKKLNINTATVDELKSHPYISYRLAASIKAFRDRHGPYHTVEDLKQLQLVDDQIYRKLAPYLTVKEEKHDGLSNQ